VFDTFDRRRDGGAGRTAQLTQRILDIGDRNGVDRQADGDDDSADGVREGTVVGSSGNRRRTGETNQYGDSTDGDPSGETRCMASDRYDDRPDAPLLDERANSGPLVVGGLRRHFPGKCL